MQHRFQTFDRYPTHTDYRFVDWDEYAVGEERDLLGTDGVATCLAITLYDGEKRRGALAHISGIYQDIEELKPQNIIGTLLSRLEDAKRIDLTKLEATLSGEGCISSERQRCSPIVKSKLKEYGIPIIGEDLCRAPARLVFLHCDTGRVGVYRA
ncbi:TPA: hypothetical protein HA251_00020 [Candidatus Woesearchaeota archaeon]|nr:hypothetical protein [Candidatus Woesearchaeota archaeon]